METGLQVRNNMQIIDVDSSMKLITISEKLFKSGLYPGVKNPEGAFAIVQYGAELGIPPMQALQNINLIKGKPACNSQMIQALALRNGVTYEIVKSDDKECRVKLFRNGMSFETIFTIEEAKSANLVTKDSAWEKYPSDMLFARAMARGVRRIAPDALMGLYTFDELSNGMYQEPEQIPREVVKVIEPKAVSEQEQGEDGFTTEPGEDLLILELEPNPQEERLLKITYDWFDEVNAELEKWKIGTFDNPDDWQHHMLRYFHEQDIEITAKLVNSVANNREKFLLKFAKWMHSGSTEEQK
jgi:hypothetical protein